MLNSYTFLGDGMPGRRADRAHGTDRTASVDGQETVTAYPETTEQ